MEANEAIRVPFWVDGGEEIEVRRIEKVLGLQSLQKGPVEPSDPGGCTHIPGSNGPPCVN